MTDIFFFFFYFFFLIVCGLGTVFPATPPFFSHTINITESVVMPDQTLILDTQYWKKKGKTNGGAGEEVCRLVHIMCAQ